jgi:hypothetical protein
MDITEQVLVVPNTYHPSEVTLSKAQEFISRFPIYQVKNGVPLLLHFDQKSRAYYVTCHIDGDTLISNADTDAVLDAEDEEYKLNRDLSLDKYAYRLMQDHALEGRSFEDVVIEYDITYRAEKSLKVYGGQHRIEAITKAVEANVNVVHGCRVYFDLSRDQKVEIATVNNTSIAVPSDLLDRMQEDQLGSELRDWCQTVGLLKQGENFSDRGSADTPTVRVARTLITNFYFGKETQDNGNQFYQPVLCSSGPGIDTKYEQIRSQIDWSDPALEEMGRRFAALHELQMERVNSRTKGKNAASARKALSLALVASWAFASGLFQRNPEYLQKHYALSDAVSPSDDPLNANELSKARLKGKDKENYRGLGTRNDPSELGRMFQLFLLQAENGKGITLDVANTAIKYYEARKMAHEADQDKRKL